MYGTEMSRQGIYSIVIRRSLTAKYFGRTVVRQVKLRWFYVSNSFISEFVMPRL
jgi:hypothetical protein